MQATARKRGATVRVRDLTNELAARLGQADPARGEPLVVEDRIAKTRSIHVIVIWDKWADLSPSDRSPVILDAYAKAKRLQGSTITATIGVTGEESLRMGLLPYGIVMMVRRGDRASPAELARAMAGAGGVVLKVGSSTELRFATREQAEDAYRELSQKVPGPYWAIVQEQARAE